MSEPRPTRWPRLPGFAVGFLAGLVWKDLGLRNVISYWGTLAPLVILTGLIGALLWTTRFRKLLVVGTGFLMALWIVVVVTPFTRWMVPGLVRSDPPRAADAIYVLSSNLQLDDDPTPAALARVTRGLELYGEGLAPRLLLSELPQPVGSYVRYTRRSAARMGVRDPSAITSVGTVRNTHDEAVMVAKLFAEKGWRTLLLVSSPTHMRRSVAAFQKAGVPEVIAVPAVETLFDAERLRIDDKVTAFGPAIHEWIGLAVYRWRGWI